jgi:hypothetical protein
MSNFIPAIVNIMYALVCLTKESDPIKNNKSSGKGTSHEKIIINSYPNYQPGARWMRGHVGYRNKGFCIINKYGQIKKLRCFRCLGVKK